MMADKSDLWKSMGKKYGLHPYAYDDIVSWRYGDFVFTPGFDIMSDTTKLSKYKDIGGDH